MCFYVSVVFFFAFPGCFCVFSRQHCNFLCFSRLFLCFVPSVLQFSLIFPAVFVCVSTTEPKDRCVVIMGFQKTRSLLSNLLRRGQRQQSATTAKVPGGSEKRKSSNDGEPAHGQEKRRPSTYVEGKIWKNEKYEKYEKRNLKIWKM